MIGNEYEDLLVEVAEHQRSRYFGKYRATVKSVGEGDNLGYITAIVPEVYGDEIESPWAAPASPFAGPGHGFIVLPEADDGVWIEFEAGDISRPIWSGGWWADGELPDPGGIQTRALITTAGHKLILDDDGSEVQLLHSGGAKMNMTDGEIGITIGQSEIKLTSAGEITLKAGQSEIKMSKTEISLKSGIGQIKISASGVDVNNGAIKAM
jgi:uncharacterized protein involved in type VI secretion and phage assembly